MKATYIKPTTTLVASMVMENLLNTASQSNIENGPGGFITKDNTAEGNEAEGAAAKNFNAWSSWDD